MKATIFSNKSILWVMILCILLCAVSSCTTTETTSQEQSTKSVLDAFSKEPPPPTEESDVSGESSAPPEMPYELPEERETAAVLVNRYELNPKSWLSLKPISEYTFAEYAYLGLNGQVYEDGNGVFYFYDYSTLHCINSGETLPHTLSYDITSIAFDTDRLYCLQFDGSLLIFDISKGLSQSVLLEEYPKNEGFANCSLYLHQGELLLYSYDQHSACNLQGETRYLPYVLSYETSQKLFEYTEDKGYVIYNQGEKNPYRHSGSDENGITLSMPGTGVLYGDAFYWWEDPYLRFDKGGNVLSRLIVKKTSSRIRVPCNLTFYRYGDEECTVIEHKFYTLSFNEFTVEDLIDHRLLWNKDGTCYLLAVTAEHLEIYHITPGVTHAELTARTEENSTEKGYRTILTWYRLSEEGTAEMLNASLEYVPQNPRTVTEDHIPLLYTSHSVYFPLREELLAFFEDHSTLEAKLGTYGVNCKVKDAFLLDSPLLPITIRILTTDDTLYFLAVEDTGSAYEYTFYTEEGYVYTHLRYSATVYANGKEIETHLTPVIYGNCADIPFIALMEGLGAEIQWEYEDLAVITLGDNTCRVNTYESSLRFGKSFPTVSQPFDAKNGNEIILRSDVLQQFLDAFCPGAEIRIDRETCTVYVNN